MAALVLVQGALAGRHLNGDSAAIDIHEMIGTEVLGWVGLVTVVAALLALRRSRWRLPVTAAGFFGLVVQIHMGFDDRLDVHLPLGIALFGLYLATALARGDREE